MRQRGGCRTPSPDSVRAVLGSGVLAGNRVAQRVRATAWKRCRLPANCLAAAVLCHRDGWRFPEENFCHEREEYVKRDNGFGLCSQVKKMRAHIATHIQSSVPEKASLPL